MTTCDENSSTVAPPFAATIPNLVGWNSCICHRRCHGRRCIDPYCGAPFRAPHLLSHTPTKLGWSAFFIAVVCRRPPFAWFCITIWQERRLGTAGTAGITMVFIVPSGHHHLSRVPLSNFLPMTPSPTKQVQCAWPTSPQRPARTPTTHPRKDVMNLCLLIGSRTVWQQPSTAPWIYIHHSVGWLAAWSMRCGAPFGSAPSPRVFLDG
jgi:hypothetical protein